MKCCLCLIQLLTVYFTLSGTVTFREHIFPILQELTCWSRYVTVSQKAREKWPEWSLIQCLPSLCTRGKTQNKQINAKQNKTKSIIVNRFAQDATAIWEQSQSWNSKYWRPRLEDFAYCLLPWWQSFIKHDTFMWCRYSNISIILYNTSVKLGTTCLLFGHLTFLDNNFTLHVVYKQCSFL